MPDARTVDRRIDANAGQYDIEFDRKIAAKTNPQGDIRTDESVAKRRYSAPKKSSEELMASICICNLGSDSLRMTSSTQHNIAIKITATLNIAMARELTVPS